MVPAGNPLKLFDVFVPCVLLKISEAPGDRPTYSQNSAFPEPALQLKVVADEIVAPFAGLVICAAAQLVLPCTVYEESLKLQLLVAAQRDQRRT